MSADGNMPVPAENVVDYPRPPRLEEVALPLRVAEARKHGRLLIHHRGVGSENHIRPTLNGFDERNLGTQTAEQVM